MIFLRSTLFNIVFFTFTAIACFLYLPTLVLPRDIYIKVLTWYFLALAWLERKILNLDYEIRGYENLPDDGAYIVAAKHFSTFETMKLPILLPDVSVILKRELMWIPLWGWFAAKARMIPVIRGSRDKAVRSICKGAQQMKREKRPIAIFPQGTRVHLDDTPNEKPYKRGVVHMAVDADLDIYPLAHNSGVFWPRKSWIKKPGRIIFEFGPRIEKGKDKNETLQNVQERLETMSNSLIKEAKSK